ncbi:YeiH family putative sulfate export transporter [Rhodopseudomonas palustris]|uniref:YeiH family putative sulfate export transporter n=1 Tax=Rhodopseudomonas palustris TaxID=1076 RepID=A0A323UNU2_RHOPL|nr:YeiH family protein [Rhodopseudomonas palustris]PZA13320.1 YeiH family putative sulfate export transporter [Rhodopseudomonas palustris]
MTVIADEKRKPHPHRRAAHFGRHLAAIAPGVLVTAGIAAAAVGLRAIPGMPGISPMLLAILIGIVAHNAIGTPAWAVPGVKFSLRRVLRFAIILLGLQLTTAQLIEVGGEGLAIIAATLLATFSFTVWFGRLIGVDRKLAELIAAGTSICGASAIIATNTVTRADDEDVAYGVACVTVFGSLAMVIYPLLQGVFGLDAHGFGLWTGSSIHEIAQVVAASFQGGQSAGEFGTIAKLSRVMMLAPLVIGLGMMARRRARHQPAGDRSATPPMPWFVLGFVAMIGVNQFVAIPHEAKSWIVAITAFLLSMALAAMGLETDLRKLAARGLRPALLGLTAALFIANFSLALIKLTGWHG